MGSRISKPLPDLTIEELASLLERLGPRFVTYAHSVRENAVDGELLNSLNEAEFAETLEDLQVSRLHQRVLTKEWKSLQRMAAPLGGGAAIDNGVPKNIVLSSADDVSTWSKEKAKEMIVEHPEWAVDHVESSIPENLHRKIFDAVSSYGLSESTDSGELEGFDRIANKAMKECNALYAGVHLLDEDGHLALSSRAYFGGKNRDDSSPPCTERLHAPTEASQCHVAIMADDRDFIVKTMGEGRSPFNTFGRDSKYVGCVTRNKEGLRVGIVCAILDGDEDVTEQKEAIMKELAAEAEQQLELRRILEERNRTLMRLLEEQKLQSSTVLPAFGPVNEVTKLDIVRHKRSPFPTPEEIKVTGKPPRTAMLPMFHNEDSATAQERAHLPENYYATGDAMGVDRTPVHKNDIERVAAVEAFALKDIPHDDPVGIALKRLTDLAANMFDCDYAEVTFLSHEKCFNIANHISCSPEAKELILGIKPVEKLDASGEPWLCSMERGLAFCNYVAYTGRTFTSHDVWADDSFAWARTAQACRFYSSSPIIVRGISVASLCIYDFRKAHPEFSTAHQIQQEQLAQMAAQNIENWALRREMEGLERLLLVTDSRQSKLHPPENAAAVVFTDIQGSTRLWETNSGAMQDALALHDRILRRCIADHNGYEVKTEGDSFHVVFHDGVDAVAFALQAQVELHDAPWSDNILGLPDACDNGNEWRGLRVRIAIHYGPVACRDNEVSGRRVYSGATINVAKSLEYMAHGGQILATVEVWNVASYFSETKLASPQVLDLGMHVLLTGTKTNEGLIEKSVVQLVPSTLAFDYSAHRTFREATDNQARNGGTGRQFPPVVSAKRLTASFHEAPHVGNVVTMMFLSTAEVETLYDDSTMILAALAKQIGAMLGQSLCGYQCKDFIVAFSTLSEAVSFGLTLQEYLKANRVAGANLTNLVKMGVHSGPFASMGPHQTTGRADYFGKVVNRASRVANAADAGEVVVGMVEGAEPALASGLETSFVGSSVFKGMQEEMDLFVCRREPRKLGLRAGRSSRQIIDI